MLRVRVRIPPVTSYGHHLCFRVRVRKSQIPSPRASLAKDPLKNFLKGFLKDSLNGCFHVFPVIMYLCIYGNWNLKIDFQGACKNQNNLCINKIDFWKLIFSGKRAHKFFWTINSFNYCCVYSNGVVLCFIIFYGISL